MPGSETNLYAPPKAPIETEDAAPRLSTSAWWWPRRWLRYNAVVITSGFAATCVAALHDIHAGSVAGSGIVAGFVFAAFVGVAYVILANLSYLAGPVLDRFVPRAIEDQYRKVAYFVGTSLAVAIPGGLTVAYLT